MTDFDDWDLDVEYRRGYMGKLKAFAVFLAVVVLVESAVLAYLCLSSSGKYEDYVQRQYVIEERQSK